VVTVPDSSLPPSRFSAGYTVGAQPASQQAARTTAAITPSPTPVAGPAAGAAAPVSAAKVDGLAVSSFVLVLLLGPFVAPVTMPMGFVARSRIARSGGAGQAFATAAVALSCVYFALGVVVIALAVTT
jgi:hypothetical protein